MAAASTDVQIVKEAILGAHLQPDAVKAAARPPTFPIRFPSQEAEVMCLFTQDQDVPRCSASAGMRLQTIPQDI